MRLLAKKLIFKSPIGAVFLAATFIMGLGVSSAEATEYYRAIEFQKMKIQLRFDSSGLSGSLLNRKIDLKTNPTSSIIGNESLGYLEAKLHMSAQLMGEGTAKVKVTLDCQFFGATVSSQSKTFTLAKDEQVDGDNVCSPLATVASKVTYKIANVQGSAKPACRSKLSKGFVVSESKSSYHSDKLVFTSEAKLTKSTSSDCTYTGTLTQTWTTNQGSGSRTYEGSVTIPLKK